MPKVRFPEDSETRRAIWTHQLNRINAAERQIIIESIEIAQEVISLELRMIAGEQLGSERSLLRRYELENRMKQLCVTDQRAKLITAIQGTKRNL